ncbi:hypothetical protein Tco_1182310 [Tanacetum coccineum]
MVDEKKNYTTKAIIFQTLPEDILLQESIMAKFKSLGSRLDEEVAVRKLLNSAPKKYLPIIASIEQYSEIETMSFEEAVGRLKATTKTTQKNGRNFPPSIITSTTLKERWFGERRGLVEEKEDVEEARVKVNKWSLDAMSVEKKDTSQGSCYTKWKNDKMNAYSDQEEKPECFDETVRFKGVNVRSSS